MSLQVCSSSFEHTIKGGITLVQCWDQMHFYFVCILAKLKNCYVFRQLINDKSGSYANNVKIFSPTAAAVYSLIWLRQAKANLSLRLVCLAFATVEEEVCHNIIISVTQMVLLLNRDNTQWAKSPQGSIWGFLQSFLHVGSTGNP